ncbi:Long-chain acyl-CoA synthetase (AMP-forming) [Halopseudomonas litoralis]|uniref:Long-chain acyl-CoA synthetase (AMP-forming) n=1 Tax=Halopseudomonas litoralis TaxID=797277 RepID=A0A1H1S2U1_9GAMM|nr:AMP-binding protein [Halopseudomonas litoralis]SDS42086.1 Long-chain acyl-CoA synthetase (AMP-forming) [Halopseudomonas litoralis]
MGNDTEPGVVPVLAAFFRQEQLHPDKAWLIQPLADGATLELSWRQAGDQARRLAGWLRHQNLPERSTIAIISKNCAHWIISDLAIWMAGHVSVPLPPTLPDDATRQTLEHAAVRVIIIGKLDDWQRVRSGLPAGIPWVGMPMAEADEQLLDWESLQRANDPLPQPVARDSAELASIMYSSGATGLPKGCMLSFASMHFAASNFLRLFLVTDRDRVLSYLPLSHVAERQFIEMQSLLSGMTVYFVQSRATFIDDLRRARPTLFLGTPATWQQLRQGVMRRAQQRILDTALKIPLLGKRVATSMLEQQGLDQLRFGVTSGDVASAELLEWYHRIGLKLFEVYGLTENCGYSHVGRPGRLRPGWCGLPNPGVECRLDENQEVLVRSQANMLGYYRDPERTARMLDEQGFLRTGDRGEIDQDGFLRLSGRITDLFHTADGRQIIPQPVEHRLLAHGFVQHACVLGEGLPLSLALITLTEPGREAARHEVERELESLLHALNEPLPRAGRLGCLVVVSDDWSADNGYVTGTMQLRRGVIGARYHEWLGDWSVRGTTIVWAD